jgi:hypothetical protein
LGTQLLHPRQLQQHCHLLQALLLLLLLLLLAPLLRVQLLDLQLLWKPFSVSCYSVYMPGLLRDSSSWPK